jgi:hypoxanthine phosphoribosyltransferase
MEKDYYTYDRIAEQVEELALKLKGEHFDVMLIITRGGLIPGAILGYRLGIRNILVAAVEFYDDHTGARGSQPTFLQFPADPLLNGQRVLVVDEVWDSGRTIQAVTMRVRQAGGEPVTAVLHYKPRMTEIALEPDHYVKATNAWIVYPWSKHEKLEA